MTMLLPKEQVDRLLVDLEFWEGKRLAPYKDPLGIWTWGIGHNLHEAVCIESLMTLTSKGFGENRVELAVQYQLEFDAHEAYGDVEVMLTLHETDASFLRTEMLTHAMFQLGPTRFGKFKKFWKAVADEHYERAAAEILYRDAEFMLTGSLSLDTYSESVTDALHSDDPLCSPWYHQTPTRALWVATNLMNDTWSKPAR